MSWTDRDTRTLRAQGRCLDCAVDPSLVHDHSAELEQRAAAEIERLQARVRELEANNEALQSHVAMRTEILAMAERADTIPRAALVNALRERAAAWERRALAALTSPQASAEERLMDHKVLIVQRVECLTLADEIERGEWPETKRER